MKNLYHSILITVISVLIILLYACQPSAVRDAAKGPHPVAEKGLLASVEYVTDKLSGGSKGTGLKSKLVPLYLHQNDTEKALIAARSISDPNERDRILAMIGEHIVQQGNHEHARAIADSIQADYFKSSILASIALSYEQAGDYRRGRELAETIPDPNFKAKALADIAVQYDREGYGDLANRIFRQAIQSAEAEQSITHRIETLVYLAVKHNQAGRNSQATDLFNEALNHTENIANPQYSSGPWKIILSSYVDAGQPVRIVDRAASNAKEIQSESDYYKNELLSAVATAYAKSGSFVKAEEILSDMDDAPARAVLSAHISALYEKEGNSQEAKRFFTITQNNIESIHIPAFRERAISECANIFNAADQPDHAIILARSHPNNAVASRLLAAVAVTYHRQRERQRAEIILHEALKVLAEGGERHETASALTDIAEAFFITGYTLSESQREELSRILHSI